MATITETLQFEGPDAARMKIFVREFVELVAEVERLRDLVKANS